MTFLLKDCKIEKTRVVIPSAVTVVILSAAKDLLFSLIRAQHEPKSRAQPENGVPHPKRSLIALRVGFHKIPPASQTQGSHNGVQLGVLIAPHQKKAGTQAAERDHSGSSAVLRHADNPGRRLRDREQRASVFTKEDEAYHTEGSNLNAHIP